MPLGGSPVRTAAAAARGGFAASDTIDFDGASPQTPAALRAAPSAPKRGNNCGRNLCRAALALANACLVTLTPCLAQSAGRDPAAADALFQQGRADAAGGNYAQACLRFEESFRLDPTAGTLLNLADCSERIGRIGAALAHFAEALKRLHAGDDRISYTEERIARLKRRVPRLTILAPTDGNTKVSRDQVEVGPGARNVPVAVEPGIHHILVQAPGHRDRQITVVLDEGDERQVRAEPGAAIPPASTPKPRGDTSPGNASIDAASPGGNAGIFPWAIGGAGLASLGVGALAGIIALDKASIVRSACGEGPRCAETGDFQTASDAARTGKEFATISTIGIGVGIAGIATATYLLLRNHGEGQAQGLRRAWSSLALNGTEITTVLVF